MQNLIQQILDSKVFIVKLQSYGLYRLILTPLMFGGNKRSSMLLKQTWNFT